MIRFAPKPKPVTIPYGALMLEGDLQVPEQARALILFVHGSGSSRFSPRNRHVAGVLAEAGLATLLIDLLTEDEELIDEQTAELRFNIPFLTERVKSVTDWLKQDPRTRDLGLGYFGASTGAAAAIMAAADRPKDVFAIVSRGGRPDMAQGALMKVKAPTLLIVGGQDVAVMTLNQRAADVLCAEHELVIVPGATHLFSEPGALQAVADLATEWFLTHLRASEKQVRSGV